MYSIKHKVMLQGIMNKGYVSYNECKDIYESANRAEENTYDDMSKEDIMKDIVSVIHVINRKITELSMEIVRQVDEDAEDAKHYYVLVSRNNGQIGSKAMTEFSAVELETLKVIVDDIMDDEDKEVSTLAVLNTVPNRLSEQGNKRVKSSDVEATYKKFVAKGWLSLSSQGTLRLSPRFLGEMDYYLAKNYGDELTKCPLCKRFVVRGVHCSNEANCDQLYHQPCLRQ